MKKLILCVLGCFSAVSAMADAASTGSLGNSLLSTIDWAIIGVFFAIVLGIGWVASKTAGKSSEEFFLGGRGMPWWLLGISMVACTFSCDTPNLVTQFVRDDGVVKNWAWWAFLITGMVTVFIYAQLWRRSKVMTDLEFYELRYSGKGASFLRGFRAIYLGVFFNCLIMGSVSLAAIKIGGVMLGTTPLVTIVGASVFVVIYASLGGIKGVIWSDFFQYGIAMAGAVYAAYVAVNYADADVAVGGLSGLLNHEAVIPKLNIMPDFDNWMSFIPLLIIPVAVQWWAVWYPGAEPGGGGYIAQKMLSAKNEKNAIGATMLFNFMHYAVRPWPWIIVALASLVIFPQLSDIKAQFPEIDPKYLKSDIAYPAMLAKILSPGWLGIVVASLIAAYMSTIGTHLNWGSSYVVNDFYKRFVKKDASEKDMVRMGRVCTVGLMVFAGFLSLTVLDSAQKGFELLFLSGAGTGAIYLLRWFWWRINAMTEIVAMIVATVLACWLVFGPGDDGVLNWYVDSSPVASKVQEVKDPALLSFIETAKEEGNTIVTQLNVEADAAAVAWKKTAKNDVEERAAAHSAYAVSYKRKADVDSALSVGALTQAYIGLKAPAAIIEVAAAPKDESAPEPTAQDLEVAAKTDAIIAGIVKKASQNTAVMAATAPAWAGTLEVFKMDFRKELLKTINKPLEAKGKELKELSAASIGFGGIIKGDAVYIYHPEVAGQTFSVKLMLMVIVVTLSWILGTLLSKPVSKEVLYKFYRQCHPGGPGWAKVLRNAKDEGVDLKGAENVDWQMPLKLLCVFIGSVVIYGALFSIGSFVYGNVMMGIILGVIAIIGTGILMKAFVKIKTD
ncbi:Sodium/glucose cotransporter [Pontiella sulfatireligans]|uniref:Sodium/glucose cotransporter n=1 Tax=Pontiella sulfatireligans TaxID=2750658 RepID=A0A6C2UPB3_9BACT|nr:sodium:solute symporter family protein [Pontiella sulfatireligans]VGO21909.1 Sodium/glucose cotransporter [Pontiella sulfatireligans]